MARIHVDHYTDEIPLAQLKRWIEGWLPPFTNTLRVNNTEAATTPGTVTHKMEVFDTQGESVGFVAVYDDVT